MLGPLRVLVDGQDIAVDDPIDRTLLTGLLLNANLVVSPVEVVRTLWAGLAALPADLPVQVARSADRVRRLVDGLPGGTRLVASTDGYRLDVDENLVDFFQAKALYDQTGNLPPLRRAELLRRAFALWPEHHEPDVAWSVAAESLMRSVVRELRAAVWALSRARATWPTSERPSSQWVLVGSVERPRRVAPSEPLTEPPPGSGAVLTATGTTSVSVYLSDEGGHTAVEAAVETALHRAGLSVVERDDPVHGSWFRRLRASEIGTMAAHAADSRLVLAHDAHVTSTLLQHLGPVLAALQSQKEAVVRLGAVLIVKLDDQLVVHQLTAAQQLQLDHQPQLAMAPREILTALRLGDRPPVDGHRDTGS